MLGGAKTCGTDGVRPIGEANMKNSPAIKNSAIPLCFGFFRNVAASRDLGWRVKKRLNGIMFILAQEVRK